MHKEGFFFRTDRNLRADAWRLKETVNRKAGMYFKLSNRWLWQPA